MAECYPQGCPPCTEEISFPENPINGQRECFSIGKDPNTGQDILKCWVYDQCVPGWRAEGPATAPVQFKGGVDLTKTEAANGITDKEAGDYYVVTVASATQTFLNSNWLTLQHPVEVGSFIMWSGTEWVEIPRPCGDGGTQVQSDWLETDVNSAAFILNKPELPEGVGNIEGGSIVITLNSTAPNFCPFSNLTLKATVNPTSADGKPVVGFFEYTWESSTNAGNWVPFGLLVRTTETSYSTTTEKVVENYNATPDRFRLSVKFTDFYGHVVEATSAIITPVAKPAYIISTHPGTVDLSSGTNGTFTVTGAGATVTEYRWYVNRVPITGPNNIPGYTMSGWTTNSLGVTRDAADAGSTYVYVDIYADSECTPVVTSNSGSLIGPEPTPPDNGADGGDGGGGPGGSPCFGCVGYRTAFRSGYQTGIYWNANGSGPNTHGPSVNEVLYLISNTIQEGFPAIAYGTLDGNGAPLDGQGPPANMPIAGLKGKWKVETMTTDSFGQRTGTLIRIE